MYNTKIKYNNGRYSLVCCWYYQCKVETHAVKYCSHVASILRYFGHQRCVDEMKRHISYRRDQVIVEVSNLKLDRKKMGKIRKTHKDRFYVVLSIISEYIGKIKYMCKK